MVRAAPLLVAACALAGSASGAGSRLSRGVKPSNVAQYPTKEDDTWACLVNKEKVIKAEYINDEFCDCPDGSDEPGSAACSHFGTHFWCPNLGFRPLELYSSRVNDGICDCCDGSDEYLTGHCGNKCAEQAKEANAAAEEETVRVRTALAKKQEIIAQGKAKRQADTAEVAKLKSELAADAAGLEAISTLHAKFVADENSRQSKDSEHLNLAKAADGAKVAGETATEPASGEGAKDKVADEEASTAAGEVSSETGAAAAVDCGTSACKGEIGEAVEVNHKGTGEWKSATIDQANEDGTYTVSFSDETETEENVPMQMLRTPVPDCGSSIDTADPHATAECGEQTQCGAACTVTCKDGYEGSSIEHRCGKDGAWTPIETAAAATACQLLPPQTPFVEKVTAEDSSLQVSFAVNSANEAKYVITATPAEGAVVTSEVTTVTGTVAEASVDGLTNGLEYLIQVEATNARGVQQATAYSRVSPTDIKKKFQDLTSAKQEKESTISSKEDKLKRDLGPGMIYSQMDGNCVEKEVSKFVYKICAFGKAEQKDGGSWNSLGNWVGWDHSDPQKPKMKFNKGTKCWNGPERSATVEMVCGPEDEILSVSEPNTCEYYLQLATPSVCTEAHLPETYGVAGAGKDEL